MTKTQSIAGSPGAMDELLAESGVPWPHTARLVAALERLGPAALVAAGHRRDALFTQQGITFEVPGADGAPARDRPFPLDLVPRVITAEEWGHIRTGIVQRIRALNAFVDDVYHGREIVHDGIVPWGLVVSRSHFARAANGIKPRAGSTAT